VGDEEIAEPKVSELIVVGGMGVGVTINVVVGGIRTGQVVPGRSETVLIMRG